MNSHYVYAHYDTTGRVFYIGKGQRKRAFQTCNRPTNWQVVAKNGGFVVKIWANNLDADTAFQMEEDWIRLYGRKDLGAGNLVNQTNGGKGDRGRLIKHSEATKAKMSAAAAGRKWSDEWKSKNRDSILQSGKLAVAARQRKIMCKETEQVFDSIAEAARQLKIGRRSINNILSGKQIGPTCGMTFRYVEKQ